MLVATALAAPASAGAATFNVNSTADGPGDCVTPGGTCTLRQAELTAASGDTIVLPAGTYDLTAAGGGDIIIDMNKQVTIIGTGARSTVIRYVGGTDPRVFLVEMNAVLNISGVTLSGGTDGAVLLFGGGNRLNATASAITGNSNDRGGGIDGTGGAVSLLDSTVSGNAASLAGGGIYVNGAAASLSLLNSTVAGNSAPSGGAAYMDQGGATLTSSTLASNAGPELFTDSGATPAASQLKNVVVGSCAGAAVTSQGGNVEPGATCGLAAAGDRPNSNPLLGPLADNGGQTDTMALRSGSAAVDAAVGCPPPPFDQRGTPRPLGFGCDSGAFEQPPTPLPAVAVAAVRGLRLDPPTLRAAGRGTTFAGGRRPPVGTRVRFRLNVRAAVRFQVRRARPGRRIGGRCVPVTRRNRRAPRCVRYVTLRGAVVRTRGPGNVVLPFRGRWGGRKLSPGGYRLAATPTASRRRGRTVTAFFRIVP